MDEGDSGDEGNEDVRGGGDLEADRSADSLQGNSGDEGDEGFGVDPLVAEGEEAFEGDSDGKGKNEAGPVVEGSAEGDSGDEGFGVGVLPVVVTDDGNNGVDTEGDGMTDNDDDEGAAVMVVLPGLPQRL
eukprot:jgi/Ulvmu1/11187/UM072_0023.1